MTGLGSVGGAGNNSAERSRAPADGQKAFQPATSGRAVDEDADLPYKPMSDFMRGDFSKSADVKDFTLNILKTEKNPHARIAHLVENGFEGSATLGAIPALHDHRSEFGMKMVEEFRTLNHLVMATNPDVPANELGMGLSFQPSTNFRNINEALLAGSGLTWNEAKKAMDQVPSASELGGATLRMVSLNREAVPPFGQEKGVQTSKHFELNVIPDNPEAAGNPFFMESNAYSSEIMGNPALGFQKLTGGDPQSGVPEPRKPATYTERLFAPSVSNSSFGTDNVIVVSDDRNFSDVRSLAKFHNTTKLEKEHVSHEKQRSIVSSLMSKLDHKRMIFDAQSDQSLNRGELGVLKASLKTFGNITVGELEAKSEEYIKDREDKLKSITPHKLAFVAETELTPSQHRALQRHKALADAIMQKQGHLPTLGAHTAVNCCGNYVAGVMELVGLGKGNEDKAAGAETKPGASGIASPFEAMSTQSLDEAERRMIAAFEEDSNAKFFEPAQPRLVFADAFADGDRISQTPNSENIKPIDAARARHIAAEGVKDPAMYELRERGNRASYFDQYVRTHNPDLKEAEIDRLAAHTALEILREEASAAAAAQELK